MGRHQQAQTTLPPDAIWQTIHQSEWRNVGKIILVVHETASAAEQRSHSALLCTAKASDLAHKDEP